MIAEGQPDLLRALSITGIDLEAPIERLHEDNRRMPVTFVSSAIRDWHPQTKYDLITCVHGLHYVGDKLGALRSIAQWLTPDGFFAANFDIASVIVDNTSTGRLPSTVLRESGFAYDTRRHLITRAGDGTIMFSYTFVGADHRAGPNYTGQPAVAGHYIQVSQ
jgi:SAM-dependent methyltransferase